MKKLFAIKVPFLNATRYTLHAQRGFTLVEMLIAFGVFAVVMAISVTSLFSILEANYRARAQKSVVNNLHFAFENMSRNLRTGSVYHCGGGIYDGPNDCPSTGEDFIIFTAHDGTRVVYGKNGGAIVRAMTPRSADGLYKDIGAADYLPITAPEITVDRLKFYVGGSLPDDGEQPRVLIVSSGSLVGKRGVTEFDIQTLVSQRLLDVEK